MATSGQRIAVAPSSASSSPRRSSSRVSGSAIVRPRNRPVERMISTQVFTVRCRPQQGRTMAKASEPKQSEKTPAKKSAPVATKKSEPKSSQAAGTSGKPSETDVAASRQRLAATGRNDACPCGSGKKYKKCHLPADEQATFAPPAAPDAKELAQNGWRLFEQRRPGAAEKEFKAALAVDPELLDARVGIGMSRLQAENGEGAKEELRAVLAAGEAAAKAVAAQAEEK